MTRDEVSYFIDLVKENKAIHSKATNAFQNQLKEIAWTQVTDAYNARFGRVPKNKQQLKLKWDNLKKMARKRLQLIRFNNLKTGGGKPICIPVDEILDKVAELLGSTGSGFEVPFGGDGTENKENETIALQEDNGEVVTTEPPNQDSDPGPSIGMS
ncbi:hypothetical protein K1T71_014838 [Dendrolimus kikuchii]|nr:hypothetical protein K1T71_015141 [Dendrolimus kikuchii]KAJ0169653.1 hypothetical protein K1T71_014838 [Dendrolimus kikuchii]